MFTLIIIFFIMAFVVLSFSVEQGCPSIYNYNTFCLKLTDLTRKDLQLQLHLIQ